MANVETKKDRLATEEAYINNVANVETEQYRKYRDLNASIQFAISDATRPIIEHNVNLKRTWIQELDDKINDANSTLSKIYDQYSPLDRQKGRFSSRDKKRIKEIQGTIQNNQAKQQTAYKELDELKYLSGNITGGLSQAEASAEQPLKFGVPKSPNSNTTSQTSSDPYNETERINNYRRQQEYAHDFETLATLIGPKVAKKLSDEMFHNLHSAQIKLSHGMDNDIAKTAELLKKYNLENIPITYNRFMDNGRSTHSVATIFRTFTSNCHQLSSLATSMKIGQFLKWPEVDGATLRARKKEPDYNQQVVSTIDQLIERIGGIEGAEIPKEVIDKLTKIRDKSAKKLPKTATKEDSIVESTGNNNTAPTIDEATIGETTAKVVENEPAPEIDPIAYNLYAEYNQSGTSLTFPTWCQEHNFDLPKGWQFVQEEYAKGFEEYLAQQQEQARQEQASVNTTENSNSADATNEKPQTTTSQPQREMEDEGMGM